MQKFIWQKGIEHIEIGKFSKFIFSSFDFGGEVSRQTETFSGMDGERIVESIFKSRTITVNGYIMAKTIKERFEFRREFFRMFDGKTEGVLHYRNNNGAWRIKAVPRLPVLGNAVGRRNSPFVLYFDCPEFYFEEEAENALPLYSRQNLLTSPVTFPCVLTKRTMTQTVENSGSFKTMPIITISARTEDVGIQETAENHISIFWGDNEKLTMKYKIDVDEVVTVDSGSLTITSNTKGNIIYCLTDDSQFPELMPGKNVITISNNSGGEIAAWITWHNREAGL